MSKTKKKPPDLGQSLRAAIKASDKSLYRIAEESGVSYPILHRFMAGKRSIGLDTASKLAGYLGLGLGKVG